MDNFNVDELQALRDRLNCQRIKAESWKDVIGAVALLLLIAVGFVAC